MDKEKIISWKGGQFIKKTYQSYRFTYLTRELQNAQLCKPPPASGPVHCLHLKFLLPRSSCGWLVADIQLSAQTPPPRWGLPKGLLATQTPLHPITHLPLLHCLIHIWNYLVLWGDVCLACLLHCLEQCLAHGWCSVIVKRGRQMTKVSQPT